MGAKTKRLTIYKMPDGTKHVHGPEIQKALKDELITPNDTWFEKDTSDQEIMRYLEEDMGLDR